MSNDSIQQPTSAFLETQDALGIGQPQYINYHELARQLMVSSRISRRATLPTMHLKSVREHLDYFKVGVSGPRQSGKTTFAAGMLKTKNGHRIDNVLVVVTNLAHKQGILNVVGTDVAPQVFTAQDVLNDLGSTTNRKLVVTVEMPCSDQAMGVIPAVDQRELRALAGKHLMGNLPSPHGPEPWSTTRYNGGPNITIDESYGIVPSALQRDDHPIRGVTLVIVDELDLVVKKGCTLEQISIWSRSAGRIPEIITIN